MRAEERRVTARLISQRPAKRAAAEFLNAPIAARRVSAGAGLQGTSPLTFGTERVRQLLGRRCRPRPASAGCYVRSWFLKPLTKSRAESDPPAG
jgi:hypothetical protein